MDDPTRAEVLAMILDHQRREKDELLGLLRKLRVASATALNALDQIPGIHPNCGTATMWAISCPQCGYGMMVVTAGSKLTGICPKCRYSLQ